MRIRFWPPKIDVGVYDPVTHKLWKSRVRSKYTNIFFEAWQHVRYVLLGRPVKHTYVVIEAVDCTCDMSVHKRSLIRTAHKGHAEEIAQNYALSYQAMWMLRDEFDFLEPVLPRGVLMGGKHKAVGPPYYVVREFDKVEDAAVFLTQLTVKRRTLWESGPKGMGMPFGEGGDDFDTEQISMREVGGALMMTRKTTKHTHERAPGWGARMAAERAAKDKKEEPTN